MSKRLLNRTRWVPNKIMSEPPAPGLDCTTKVAVEAAKSLGEIGGDAEERAAAFIEQYVDKPVVGYVAGFTAPEGKTMGHAGAIVSGSAGTAAAKQEALEAVGVKVGKTPSETAELMREIMTR